MSITKKKASLFALSLLSAASFSAYANTSSDYYVVAPSCLLKNTAFEHNTLAKTNDLNLVKTDAKGIRQLVKIKTKRFNKCGGFMDVTQAWHDTNIIGFTMDHKAKQFLNEYAAPAAKRTLKTTDYKVKYNNTVNKLLSTVNPDNMWRDLTTLSSFENRYADSDNGVKAAKWIKAQVEDIAAKSGHDDVTAYFVQTGTRYKQPSLVVKLGTGTGPGVVIGGHMDTLDSWWGSMPGADDDGSGSVTVLEAARVILNSGVKFNKPVYFVWYSAEEMGLVGSSYVVKDFKAKNIPVDAVAQFDMTGYRYKNDPTMWLMDDFVSTDLTAFTETLIKTYVKQPVKHSRCGYACSDHASWTKGGFKSVMPFEANMNSMNPDIHSTRDTMDHLSLEHMTSYAKLAVSFVTELAEPKA